MKRAWWVSSSIGFLLTLIVCPVPARAFTQTDDFTSGLDATQWKLVSNQPLYTLDDTQGDLRILKPTGGTYDFQSMEIELRAGLGGDFSVSVNFRDAMIDRVDGLPGNQIQLNVTFGGVFFAVVRSDESPGGDNVHVYVSPPGAWYGTQADLSSSGTLRIDRVGSVVSGYFNGGLLYSAAYNNDKVDRVYFSLQNNGTVDPTSVTFDDFSVTADCGYRNLESGVPRLLTEPGLAYESSNQASWMAVAVRSQPSGDWDIHLFDQPDPIDCVDLLSEVASSYDTSGVDVVVADFKTNPPQDGYPYFAPFSGFGPALAEWDAGSGTLLPNGPVVVRPVGPDNVIDMFDLDLIQGQEIAVVLEADPGVDARILLFRNDSGWYYAGRMAALFDDASGLVQYTSPATETCGLAVVNENGGAGQYRLQVLECGGVATLPPRVSIPILGAYERFGVAAEQVGKWWSGAAVRSESGGNWDLTAYSEQGGDAPPICFTGLRGNSFDPAAVDFVIWDNKLPDSLFVLAQHVPGTLVGGAAAEWDSGGVMQLCQPVSGTLGTEEIIRVFTVLGFWGGDSYEVALESSSPNLSLHLFHGDYGWQQMLARSQALASRSGSGSVFCEFSPDFIFPNYEQAIVVLVNEAAETVSYTLEVRPGYGPPFPPGPVQPAGDLGAGVADYDGDGDLDLFIANQGVDSRLLRNDGLLTFSEVPFPSMTPAAGRAPVWGDYDNDGDADLFMAVARGGTLTEGPNHLFRNDGGGSFVDVAADALPDTIGALRARWIDYDLDGRLDLSLLVNNHGLRLFRNEGLGVFAETTPGSFPPDAGNGGIGSLHDAAWGDYDLDGDMDVYLGRSTSNYLMRNEGGGMFTDVTSPPIDVPGVTYDAEWADLDNDGYPDLYLTGSQLGAPNRIFRNVSGLGFVEFPDPLPLGIFSSYDNVASGDYDRDGDIDLFVTCYRCESKIVRNNGAMSFEAVPLFTNPDSAWTEGVVLAGLRGYGELEALILADPPPNNLFPDFSCSAGHWLEVDLQGTVSNRDGVGARIEVVTSQGNSLTRWVSSSGGFGSVGPLRAHFGLGDASPDSVRVFWPSGILQTRTDVTSDQRITIVETDPQAAVPGGDGPAPTTLLLSPPEPNPSRGTVSIRYELPEPTRTTLRIFDVIGRLVRTLVDAPGQTEGRHEVLWSGTDDDGRRAPAGLYYYELRTSAGIRTGRLIRIQ